MSYLDQRVSPARIWALAFVAILHVLIGIAFVTGFYQRFTKDGVKDLDVFDVEEIPTHGGSLRVYARHADDETKPVGRAVGELLAQEESFGLVGIDRYRTFAADVEETKRSILELLIRLKSAGKTIAGYGAPGKGNTLLNYCGIRTDFLDFTVDRNTYKQGLFLPGTHIPILGPEEIGRRRPDYLFILPWNVKQEIMVQMAGIREWGGQFIVPIPKARVV